MAHPKLQLSRLLDWIKLRIECEDTPPTDEQIVAFLGLDSEQTARSMLADLADRGDITIKGTGSARQITLGRQHREIETPRPVPSVVKPRRAPISEEECAARIQAIMSLGKPKLPDSPAVEMEAPGSGEGERQDEPIVHEAKATSTPEAAPQYSDLPPSVISQLSKAGQAAIAEGKPLQIDRLPTAPGRRVAVPNLGQCQVNIKVSAERYAELRRRANGGHVGPIAKQIFDAAMDGEARAASAPTPLFRIPAEVTRAATKAGIPVLDFAATLMMRGLGSFEQDAAREIAA